MTAPNPKTVRAIAAAAIRRAYQGRLASCIITELSTRGIWNAEMHAAVESAADTVELSWPDEQQPAEAASTHCICGCELGKPCGCDDDTDHDPAEATGGEQAQGGVVADDGDLVPAWKYFAMDPEVPQDGATGRLWAMLGQLDRYAAQHPICRCGRDQTVLGEILSMSVDCEVGHGDLIGAGNATGEDLRAVLADRDALAARVAELEGEREADTRPDFCERCGGEPCSECGECPAQGCWDCRCACEGDDEDEAADTCRPVTVLGDDGEPIHTRVHGAEPMSEEGQAAWGEIVRAASRKHLADLRAEREAREADVRAVAALAAAEDGEPLDRAISDLIARFADRIEALADDACDCDCQPGRPCVCGLEDCECVGGCPVCDRPEPDETSARFLYLAKRTHLNYVPDGDKRQVERDADADRGAE
jgi:hypothetical protein